MASDSVAVLVKARSLVEVHGHTTFERSHASADHSFGYCVGQAMIDASDSLFGSDRGRAFAAWAEARRLFCTTNGVKADEYASLADEAAVGWNDRAVALGLPVTKNFDRAIAHAEGGPLPDAVIIAPYEACVGCSRRLEPGDDFESQQCITCWCGSVVR